MSSNLMPEQSRRRFARKRPQAGVLFVCRDPEATDSEQNFALSMLEFSQSGIRLIVPRSWPVGHQLRVELKDPSRAISVIRSGRVVWSVPNDDGTYVIGLEWQQLISHDEIARLGHQTQPAHFEEDTEIDEAATSFVGKVPLRRLIKSKACLVQIYPKGPDLGRKFLLDSAPLVLGRKNSCDLVITDTSVSRQHACVQPFEDSYEVVDLGSTNGTFVNEIQINEKRLEDGDSIQIGSYIYRYLCADNLEAEYHEELYQLSTIDGLTKVANKRALLDGLTRELSRAIRHDRALSVILLDADHFKQINDSYGHLVGDHTLQEIARRLRTVVRTDELLARCGGEEFAVVLPETTTHQAVDVAERMRMAIEQRPFEGSDGRFRVTISAGVTTYFLGQQVTADDLLKQADECLYQAKQQGRNCVVASEMFPRRPPFRVPFHSEPVPTPNQAKARGWTLELSPTHDSEQ